MRAIGCLEFGGPDVLRVVDLPVPAVGPGEVRIRVHAATVNPVDIGIVAGGQADRMTAQQPPYIPGMDAAGTVEELGAGVGDRLRVGESVMAMLVPRNPSKGAYAQHVVVPAESVVTIPPGFGFVAAAAVLMNAATARLCLDAAAVGPGETLLVTGAAGALGGHVLELARDDGVRVLADASDADAALVREMGATEVVPGARNSSTRSTNASRPVWPPSSTRPG